MPFLGVPGYREECSERKAMALKCGLGSGLEARCEISQLGVKKGLWKRFERQVWQRHGRILVNILFFISFPYQGNTRRRQSTPYTPFAEVRTVATEVVRYKPLRKTHCSMKEYKAQVVATSHVRFRSWGRRYTLTLPGMM